MPESPYARALALHQQQNGGIQYSNPGMQYPALPSMPAMPTYPAPAPRPASIWDVYQRIKEPEPNHSPVHSAVTGLRHNAEGGLLGAVLGFIHGEFGSLDILGKYPVDGIAAVLLYGLSIRDAGKPDGFASDLRALSQSATTVCLYRKTREWRENSKKPKPEKTSAASPTSVARDPLVEAGRALLDNQ